jgi:hypothetical protein
LIPHTPVRKLLDYYLRQLDWALLPHADVARPREAKLERQAKPALREHSETYEAP